MFVLAKRASHVGLIRSLVVMLLIAPPHLRVINLDKEHGTAKHPTTRNVRVVLSQATSDSLCLSKRGKLFKAKDYSHKPRLEEVSRPGSDF